MSTPIEQLDRKRFEALTRITQTSFGTALSAGVPTPALELTKTLGIAAADAWLLWDLYRIYYGEQLSAEKLEKLLGTAGLIVFTGAMFSYGSLKVTQAFIDEVLNVFPLARWWYSATFTGSSTFMLGVSWMFFLEEALKAAAKTGNLQ
jgi:hypothetical protein